MPQVVPQPVLQDIGIGKPLDFSGWREAAQLAQQNKNTADRQKEIQQQRQDMLDKSNVDYVTNQITKAGTGSDDDPYTMDYIKKAQDTAYTMAQQHKSMADIQIGIKPFLDQAAAYKSRLLFINQNIQKQIALHKGDPGFDAAQAEASARDQALFTTDAKGNKIRKDPMTIDPAINYVDQAIATDPSVTNMGGLDEYVNKAKISETPYSNTTPIPGTLNSTQTNKYTIKAPSYMTTDKNDDGTLKTNSDGSPVGMVPQFENIKDDKGNTIGRAVTDGVYNQITQSQHGSSIAAAVFHQAQQHFQNLGQNISTNDPKFKLMEKSIMYDELNQRNNTSIGRVDSEHTSTVDAETARMNDPNYRKNVVQLAADKAAAEEAARNRVKAQNGTLDQTPKQKVAGRIPAIVDAINGKNDNAQTVSVQTDPDDDKSTKDMVDLKSATPDGKFAHGGGQFADLYYSPSDDLIYFKKVQGAKQFQTMSKDQFLKLNATSNGTDAKSVDKLLEPTKKTWKDIGDERLKKSGELPQLLQMPLK